MNIEIANRLVNLRKSNNLSQEALAEKLGISRQAVSKWERAEASPDTDNLILLARLYKVSLDELLRTEDEVPMPEPPEAEADIIERTAAPGTEVMSVTLDDAAAENRIAASEEEDGEDEEGYGGSYTIPVSTIIIIVYLFIGNMFNAWHPGWLLFLLIPIWSSLALAIRKENANCFAYPALATLIYLCLGWFWALWHPGWIIFLTVPLYYWAVSYIRSTRRRRKRNTGKTLNDNGRVGM